MGDSAAVAVIEETDDAHAEIASRQRRDPPKRKRQPPYHVILWDDQDHSYDYVIKMMKAIFGHGREKALEIASEVDDNGRAICLTTTLEHAELKRDQIQAFGKDELITRCVGSMSASVQAAK